MVNKENEATKKHRKCVKGADISRQQKATTEAAARRTCECNNVKRRTRHSKQGTTMANEEQPIVSREQEQNIRGRKGNSEKYITVEERLRAARRYERTGFGLRLRVQSLFWRSDFDL
jgi:hypothetical protein